MLDAFPDRVRRGAGCHLQPVTQRRHVAARVAALVAHPATLSSLSPWRTEGRGRGAVVCRPGNRGREIACRPRHRCRHRPSRRSRPIRCPRRFRSLRRAGSDSPAGHRQAARERRRSDGRPGHADLWNPSRRVGVQRETRAAHGGNGDTRAGSRGNSVSRRPVAHERCSDPRLSRISVTDASPPTRFLSAARDIRDARPTLPRHLSVTNRQPMWVPPMPTVALEALSRPRSRAWGVRGAPGALQPSAGGGRRTDAAASGRRPDALRCARVVRRARPQSAVRPR